MSFGSSDSSCRGERRRREPLWLSTRFALLVAPPHVHHSSLITFLTFTTRHSSLAAARCRSPEVERRRVGRDRLDVVRLVEDDDRALPREAERAAERRVEQVVVPRHSQGARMTTTTTKRERRGRSGEEDKDEMIATTTTTTTIDPRTTRTTVGVMEDSSARSGRSPRAATHIRLESVTATARRSWLRARRREEGKEFVHRRAPRALSHGMKTRSARAAATVPAARPRLAKYGQTPCVRPRSASSSMSSSPA